MFALRNVLTAKNEDILYFRKNASIGFFWTSSEHIMYLFGEVFQLHETPEIQRLSQDPAKVSAPSSMTLWE